MNTIYNNEITISVEDRDALSVFMYGLPGVISRKLTWNDLMPVVDRIEVLGYYPHMQYLRSEKDKRHFFNITDQNHSAITSQLAETKIEAVYKAVLEFINYYNQQSK